MMKFTEAIFILVLAALALTTESCSKGATPAFEVALEFEFDIPNSGVAPGFRGTRTVSGLQTFFAENLSTNGVSQASVTSISSGRAVFRSLQNVDLSFIREISILAVDRETPDIKRELFYRTDIRFDEGFSIELLGSLSELKDILSDPLVDIEIVLDYRNTIPINFIGELQFTYLVFDE